MKTNFILGMRRQGDTGEMHLSNVCQNCKFHLTRIVHDINQSQTRSLRLVELPKDIYITNTKFLFQILGCYQNKQTPTNFISDNLAIQDVSRAEQSSIQIHLAWNSSAITVGGWPWPFPKPSGKKSIH